MDGASRHARCKYKLRLDLFAFEHALPLKSKLRPDYRRRAQRKADDQEEDKWRAEGGDLRPAQRESKHKSGRGETSIENKLR
jgi:hypothetical protein